MNASRGIKIARLASGRNDEEQSGPPSGGPPAPSSPLRTATTDVAIRYAVEQQRAHHQPVAHVRAGDLRPGERREREPQPAAATIDRPAGTRSRRRARSVVQAKNPANGMRGHVRTSTSASRGRGRRPSRPAATALLPQEPVEPEPREQRVEHDERAHRGAAARASGEQDHRRHVEPAALRVGREPVARASRRGSTAGCARRRVDRPRNVNRGSQKARMSGWSFVSSGWNANPRSANSTPATMSAGPATACRPSQPAVRSEVRPRGAGRRSPRRCCS